MGRRIAAGGMGVVHLGEMVTPAGTRKVAIKRIMERGDLDRADEMAAAHERMIAEAKLVFQLTHANICQVLDLATSEDGTFIVMEYVPGLDLWALLLSLSSSGRLLDVPIAVHILAKVAEGLDYAHRTTDAAGHPLRLVHGDVTPRNILLSRDGEVKLTDFGIARAIGMLAPGNRLRGGTPGFIAPEILDDGSVDHRADLYALGVSLYVALSGADPEAAIDLNALRAARREVSEELVSIVAQAAARRAEDRFATAAQFEHALHVHLARRFPGTTRSALCDVVRAHVPSGATSAVAGRSGTLRSMTRADVTTTFTSEPTGTPDDEPQAVRRTRKVSPHRRRSKLGLWAVLGLGLVGGGYWAGSRPSDDVPEPTAVTAASPAPEVTPSLTAVSLDPPRVSAAPRKQVATPVTISRPLQRSDRTAAVTPVRELGFLTIASRPWGAVYVDGRRVADETPVDRVPVTPGPHKVTIVNPESQRSSPPRAVNVAAGRTVAVSIQW